MKHPAWKSIDSSSVLMAPIWTLVTEHADALLGQERHQLTSYSAWFLHSVTIATYLSMDEYASALPEAILMNIQVLRTGSLNYGPADRMLEAPWKYSVSPLQIAIIHLPFTSSHLGQEAKEAVFWFSFSKC